MADGLGDALVIGRPDHVDGGRGTRRPTTTTGSSRPSAFQPRGRLIGPSRISALAAEVKQDLSRSCLITGRSQGAEHQVIAEPCGGLNRGAW